MPLKANIQVAFRNLCLSPEADTWRASKQPSHLMPQWSDLGDGWCAQRLDFSI